MAENTTASRRVQAAEREKAAFALRIAGATYAQIGAQLGVTGCAAHKMVKRVLERTRGETDAEAVELRRLETERLDALQVALWGLASKGDAGAIDRILKIMERRATDIVSTGKPEFNVTRDKRRDVYLASRLSHFAPGYRAPVFRVDTSGGTVGYTASTSSVNWSGMTCNYFASDGHIESAPLD